MNVERIIVDVDKRADKLRPLIKLGARLGTITSIDGGQLVTLVLDPNDGTAQLWESPLSDHTYPSMSSVMPQCHWFERFIWDMFGLIPRNHPRLKHNLLHEPYEPNLVPLQKTQTRVIDKTHRDYHHLEVKGKGVYEIPVGPIHAGIIEPGHFRFSCLGEIIVNLEIRLGYVHRGIERRLTEVAWNKARFVAEAAASDSAAANALAHAIALESIWGLNCTPRANALRTLSLEIERIAMHIADLGGMAADIGFLAIGSSMSRLRGDALRLGELLTGSRFQRSFIVPGGVGRKPSERELMEIRENSKKLKRDLVPVIDMFLSNQVACDRMQKTGRLSPKLAADFGMVGVGGRASGIQYDARQHFQHGLYPEVRPTIATQSAGDAFSRAKVRVAEISSSMKVMEDILENLPAGEIVSDTPGQLVPNQVGMGLVESHRGELIHLVFTGDKGEIIRYAIKDASVNNWTALAIAVRNNLVSDFPLCNKSFSLSYSGHDL
jgi:Ni,Fe-hydrogenase III large subunit